MKLPVIIAGVGLILAKLSVHMTLHIIGFLLAGFLAIVSCNSYRRDRRAKILLLVIAFVLIDLQQLLELFESAGVYNVNIAVPVLGIELVHFVSFSSIAFLAAGILRK